MPEAPDGIEPSSPEDILASIHVELKDEDAKTRLGAIRRLLEQTFSSPAILHTLEQMALRDPSKSVRAAARQALDSPAHLYIQGRIIKLKPKERQTILSEIDDWEAVGLIQAEQAEVLRKRYNFDMRPAATVPQPETETHHPKLEPAPAPETSESSPSKQPAASRSDLTQTLLSETSIKIALYLGAFFVIAAAAILAAVVEAARLPILLAATVLFAGGAVVMRARLPQPSFALFIVFSFLLPTDANVIADILNLSDRVNAGYWFGIMAAMALIWSFGTWFYTSRLFSLAAFIALAISVVRLGELFDEGLEIYLLLLSFTTLLGLGGTFLLKRWRSAKFSLPLFLLAQITHIGLIVFALATVAIRLEDFPSVWNLASTVFWALTMTFYVLSNLVFPFALFPWFSIAALYPLPLNFMLIFDVEALPVAIAAWAWGFLIAMVGELIRRLQVDGLRRYGLPAIAISLLSILTAIFIGFVEEVTYGFIFTLVSAVLYTLLHIVKPRAYIWTTALLLGVGAYFSFFELPLMENIDIFLGYQLLGISLLLLVPDLFLQPDLSANKTWRWPLRNIGALLALFNLVLVLPLSTDNPGQVAMTFGIYAVFSALYALKFSKAVLGYIATITASLAVTFALQHFEVDAWVFILTALSALYFLGGFIAGRNETKTSWSNMLRYSGLALTSLVSLLAIFNFEESGGWYVLVAALLFGVEMFSRRKGVAEAGIQIFLASGVFLFLREAEIARGYQWLAIALAILGTDLFLGRAYTGKRILAWFSRGVGALIVAINSLDLIFNNTETQISAICFAVYALFFLTQAISYRQALLGFGFTAGSTLAIIFTLRAFDQTNWLLPITLLGIIYYGIGFFLRKRESIEFIEERSNAMKLAFDWPLILWTSGIGAGFLATIAAPVQGGLSAAIPPAVVATMVTVEAFDRRNVWLGFPANVLYLMAYFILLIELKVDEPQFFSIATAALGLLMHYLLTRAGSRTGAFITGMVSQLVLLSTTYIQFLSTERLIFFVVIFFQALAVLGYGVVIRSRSLVITPIVFAVLSVMTVLYGLLEGILPVILIGCTGLILLLLGILAVIMRDRLKQIGERFSDWTA